MNKSFVTIVFLVATLLSMGAISEKPDYAITLKFQEHSENLEIAGILKALDASQVTATLYADSLKAKYYEIWMVECSGSENKRTKIGYKKIEPDSTKITFTAVPKDSTNVAFSFMRLSSGVPRMTASVETDYHILIGCDYEWKFHMNDTIPLVGYSDGIHHKIKLGNGQILEGLDICGLRFSKIHPSKWKEEYNLSDYLFFEAIPVKEMSF